MNWRADLTQRHRQDEIMDDPQLDDEAHRDALRGLARVNAISGTARTIWKIITREIGEQRPEPLRILDVACGGGDVTIGIAQLAKRAGWTADVVGCDLSPVAVRVATEQAKRRQSAVAFLQRDVLSEGLPEGFDVICCSLFLHHLSQDQAVAFLRDAHRKAGQLVIVSDLNRTLWGYLLARLGCRILSRSPVVHFDGPVSVKAAWTTAEAEELARLAGMTAPRIRRSWPARYCLLWKRS